MRANPAISPVTEYDFQSSLSCENAIIGMNHLSTATPKTDLLTKVLFARMFSLFFRSHILLGILCELFFASLRAKVISFVLIVHR
jgi:hypothetical protein